MAAHGRRLGIGAIVAVALALAAAWLRFGTAEPGPPRSGSTGDAADPGARAQPLGGAAREPPTPSLAPRADPAPGGAPAASHAAVPAAAAPPPPEEGPDAESWRRARVAFRPRELGRLGASVKVGLDAARRDMAFCFRQAAGASAQRGDPASIPRPAILLLYLEARKGALDVVDTRVDYLGDATPELVACCREVLRGFEIPAFDAEPGQRYRLKFTLE